MFSTENMVFLSMAVIVSSVRDLDPVGSGPFVVSGNFDRIRPPKGAYYQSEKMIFSHKHFQCFIYSANHEKTSELLVKTTLKRGILNYFLSQSP
jgi:hypothetical protein